jgi:hypothetical protein
LSDCNSHTEFVPGGNFVGTDERKEVGLLWSLKAFLVLRSETALFQALIEKYEIALTVITGAW